MSENIKAGDKVEITYTRHNKEQIIIGEVVEIIPEGITNPIAVIVGKHGHEYSLYIGGELSSGTGRKVLSTNPKVKIIS